MLAHQRTWLLM